MIEIYVTFAVLGAKETTKSTHFFVIAFSRKYTCVFSGSKGYTCSQAADFHSEMCLRLVKLSENNPKPSYYHRKYPLRTTIIPDSLTNVFRTFPIIRKHCEHSQCFSDS